MSLLNAPVFDYGNAKIKIEVGLLVGESFEWVELGTFYVTEVNSSNNFKNLSLTLYDGFCKMTDTYETNLSFGEIPMQSFYNELQAKLLSKYNIVLRIRSALITISIFQT